MNHMFLTHMCSCFSVGQLKDLDNLSTPDSNSGLYVLPERVKYCGRLMSIKANGFFIIKSPVGEYTFRVRVYRQVCEDGIYRQFYSRRFDHVQDNNDTYGTIVLTENLGFQVMRNDLIGILVDSECRSDGRCPFQPTIQSNSTSQVLYHSGNSVNNLQVVTGIFLNVEASIGKYTEPTYE